MSDPAKETQISIAAASSMFPGFRFSPTDSELISFYLKKKIEGSEESVEVISEIDICKYEPWDLPAKSVIPSNHEWFFFSPRGRKYPNGSQSKRATELGYWKATGKERNVKSGSDLLGTKRTLVFHLGRAPKGERTEWILHEYCMSGNSQDSLVVCRLRKNSDFRVNDTVNQPVQNPSHLTGINDSSSPVSEAVTGRTAISEVDRAVEGCSKKCTSSFDSHSIEQIDSASESDLKPTNDMLKDSEDEDDCYAEILKDDIITLDEPPPDPNISDSVPFQGTASRRIRLKKPKRRSYRAENKSKIIFQKSEHVPKDLSLSSMTVKCRLISLLLVFLTVLVVLLFSSGGSRQVNMFTCMPV